MILLALPVAVAVVVLVVLQVRACMQDQAAITAWFAREHAARATERAAQAEKVPQ
jgi:hypothetical protein